MPPYLVDAAPTDRRGLAGEPQPGHLHAWEEFAKQLFWDWQLGEAFVLATSPLLDRLAGPFPRGAAVDGQRRDGRRVPPLHDRPRRRHQRHAAPPLPVARSMTPTATARSRPAGQPWSPPTCWPATRRLARPRPSRPALLEAPEELTPDQAETLRNDWVTQRIANPGIPAVLSGGLKWSPTQLNPKDMALLELSQFTDSKIAVLLGVPPFLVGLPAGGDSMTYSNVTSLFDYHWRPGCGRPPPAVMAGLSEWLLPRGTTVEVNQDAYVQPGPYERAQTAQILVGIGVDVRRRGTGGRRCWTPKPTASSPGRC